jgi:DNA-binding transcriptional ArsR family regulator
VTRRHTIDLAELSDAAAEIVADTMQALATPSRVRILARLAAAPRSVTELARDLEMEQPAVSQQLRVLRELGLVTGDRRGRQVIYSLHDDHVAVLLAEAIAHTQHLNTDAPPGQSPPATDRSTGPRFASRPT